MGRPATEVNVTPEERAALERRIKAATSAQRDVVRARIVLMAATGAQTEQIAAELGLRAATVSKWRKRWASAGLDGLNDAPRPGARVVYGDDAERRVLAKLDEPPPSGYATWNGTRLSRALGYSADYIWRVLRKHRIALQRRRSWCISTDPEFASKAADVVGLYLAPPENAVVLCVDEKPHIQALERTQGYLKLPDGRALTGYSHEYKRNGTTTLFAALEVATGQVQAGHFRRRRRVDFLEFMNQVIANYPDREIHVIMDNLSTHKPKRDGWLARHRNVHCHYTPTHASWLNQIEVWFSILSRHALRSASFANVKQLRQAIDRFVAAYNETAAPFEWTKAQVHQKKMRNTYAELRK